MAVKYIGYVPARRGIAGAEYLQEVISDDMTLTTVTSSPEGVQYCVVTCDDADKLTNFVESHRGKFSIQLYTESEFKAECFVNYNPLPDSETGITPPTFTELMDNVGVTVTESDLDLLKIFKVERLKNITKRKFPPLNDALADLAKIVTLLNAHYDDLSDTTEVDAITARVKAIYDVTTCIDAYNGMVTDLENILGPYYTKKVSIESATDEDEVNDVVIE